MQKMLVLFLFALSSYSSTAQCEKVFISGNVVDSIRPKAFYNLMIINRSTGQGVFGRPDGSFSLYTKANDTIALSVKGYPLVQLVAVGDSNCQQKVRFYIESDIQEVEEVIVRPIKSLEEIKAEREALAMRETRMVTGIEMMQSPITALYQAFSRKEKSKRWVAEQEFKDDKRRVVRELLRTYVAAEIIELNDQDFDDFIAFLNVDENFLKTASEMELITFIKDKYEHYKLFGNSPYWKD